MAARDVWGEHVERWEASGLTAAQYAEQAGVNASSLKVWRWRLRRECSRVGSRTAVAALLQVRTPEDGRVEVELRGGQRLRVPPSFDVASLRRLIELLEGVS